MTPQSAAVSYSAEESCTWEQRVGRFEVTGELGSGGMGLVVSAFDPQLDRRVALKLIHGGQRAGDRERMLTEARAMARLNHPNVVKVFEAGVDDGQVYLAMEEIAGGTLREYLQANDLSWRGIVDLFTDAGRGLSAAHTMGLVHRDFKPENVLIGRDGRVCVGDFGLVGAPVNGRVTSAALGGPETCAGLAIGTPVYMAPEQRDGSALDARADQFAFCVALWEALYGQLPFRGADQLSYYDAIRAQQIAAPPASGVPRWVQAVLRRGLSADPRQRYPSMTELLAEFAEDRFKPIGRRRSLLFLAGAMVISPAIGMFVQPTFTRLVTVIAVALTVCGVALWRVREVMWRNNFNRRVTRSALFGVTAMICGGAGLGLLGADASMSRILNPLLVGAVVAVFGVSITRRVLWVLPLFVIAFFVAAMAPSVAPLALSAANGLSIAGLWMLWRQSNRRAPSTAVSFGRLRASNSIPPYPAQALSREIQQVGRFPILAACESAAAGSLLEAFDPKLQRCVAVWFTDSEQSSAIRHPNIVTVYETGEHNGRGYSVMEPLSGRTLASELEAPGLSDWKAVVSQFAEAGHGLAAAHAKGMVHRAFSASYAFVDNGVVRVGGFRPSTPRWEHTRSMLAPEVVDGHSATAASDQFSFCAALYAALFGQPFELSGAAAYRASVVAGPRPRATAAPTWLRSILERGMSVDPARRYPSMSALLAALQPAPRDFGPGRRLWKYMLGVLPIAAVMPLAIKGLPLEFSDGLSYELMAAINLVALVPMLAVAFVMRARVGGTQMSRTLLGAFGVGLGATVLLVIGASVAGIAPRIVECLHLCVWATVVGALSIVHDARLWPSAVALGIAFLVAASAPFLIYVCIMVPIVILTINLELIVRR